MNQKVSKKNPSGESFGVDVSIVSALGGTMSAENNQAITIKWYNCSSRNTITITTSPQELNILSQETSKQQKDKNNKVGESAKSAENNGADAIEWEQGQWR